MLTIITILIILIMLIILIILINMINNNRWRPPALRQPLTDSRDSFVLTVSALGREREGERERARASERERETERARECALSLPTTARVSAAAAPVPLLTAGVDIVPEIAQKYGGDGSEFVLVDSFENEMAQ
jgi:hypothetical protein